MYDDIDWLSIDSFIWENDFLKDIKNAVKITKAKDKKMTYGWHNPEELDRANKVAEIALDALEKGITAEQLLKRNPAVRAFYADMKVRRENAAKEALREAERKQKALEQKAAKEAAKAEIMSRLTPEELEAFGLNKPTRKRK